MNFKVGDTVAVKQGVIEPDLQEFEIGGWQGTIVEIGDELADDDLIVLIEWDSETLKQIPDYYIKDAEEEGVEWNCMNLYASELTESLQRDDTETRKKTIEEIATRHQWSSFGEQGDKINKILEGVTEETAGYEKWNTYLKEHLSFPISAIVEESDSPTIKEGTKVTINGLHSYHDMYGIIVKTPKSRQTLQIPLCNLMVEDKKSQNFQLIENYKTWFGNR